ncbi:beta-ketoacyl synthase N-terminal-like domain-containing protein [Cupriavidus basilensis]
MVGGVDSLCHTTLYGFNSLELVSSQPCRPYDAHRNGISIGEGAAFGLLEPPSRGKRARAGEDILLLGIGESSDAHHMCSAAPAGPGRPHGDGAGAVQRRPRHRRRSTTSTCMAPPRAAQ